MIIELWGVFMCSPEKPTYDLQSISFFEGTAVGHAFRIMQQRILAFGERWWPLPCDSAEFYYWYSSDQKILRVSKVPLGVPRTRPQDYDPPEVWEKIRGRMDQYGP